MRQSKSWSLFREWEFAKGSKPNWKGQALCSILRAAEANDYAALQELAMAAWLKSGALRDSRDCSERIKDLASKRASVEERQSSRRILRKIGRTFLWIGVWLAAAWAVLIFADARGDRPIVARSAGECAAYTLLIDWRTETVTALPTRTDDIAQRTRCVDRAQRELERHIAQERVVALVFFGGLAIVGLFVLYRIFLVWRVRQ